MRFYYRFDTSNGFLLARSKHYRWMYVAGFAILTGIMLRVFFCTPETSVVWSVIVALLAGECVLSDKV
jgi:hypothetical protein